MNRHRKINSVYLELCAFTIYLQSHNQKIDWNIIDNLYVREWSGGEFKNNDWQEFYIALSDKLGGFDVNEHDGPDMVNNICDIMFHLIKKTIAGSVPLSIKLLTSYFRMMTSLSRNAKIQYTDKQLRSTRTLSYKIRTLLKHSIQMLPYNPVGGYFNSFIENINDFLSAQLYDTDNKIDYYSIDTTVRLLNELDNFIVTGTDDIQYNIDKRFLDSLQTKLASILSNYLKNYLKDTSKQSQGIKLGYSRQIWTSVFKICAGNTEKMNLFEQMLMKADSTQKIVDWMHIILAVCNELAETIIKCQDLKSKHNLIPVYYSYLKPITLKMGLLKDYSVNKLARSRMNFREIMFSFFNYNMTHAKNRLNDLNIQANDITTANYSDITDIFKSFKSNVDNYETKLFSHWKNKAQYLLINTPASEIKWENMQKDYEEKYQLKKSLTASEIEVQSSKDLIYLKQIILKFFKNCETLYVTDNLKKENLDKSKNSLIQTLLRYIINNKTEKNAMTFRKLHKRIVIKYFTCIINSLANKINNDFNNLDKNVYNDSSRLYIEPVNNYNIHNIFSVQEEKQLSNIGHVKKRV
ncbi:MAG: hypothetical protein GY730_05480 [bacterium]|nr:hypothetical protein [bacterium]